MVQRAFMSSQQFLLLVELGHLWGNSIYLVLLYWKSDLFQVSSVKLVKSIEGLISLSFMEFSNSFMQSFLTFQRKRCYAIFTIILLILDNCLLLKTQVTSKWFLIKFFHHNQVIHLLEVRCLTLSPHQRTGAH